MTAGKGGLLDVYYISAGQDAGQDAGQNVPDFPFPIRPRKSALLESRDVEGGSVPTAKILI